MRLEICQSLSLPSLNLDKPPNSFKKRGKSGFKMAKGKGKAAFRGNRGSKNASQDDDPMAFKRASRVNKITSASDAGFEGQDAFGLGDDEIALDGHTNGANG